MHDILGQHGLINRKVNDPMFTGRSVLITGGTRGLGKAIGLAFATHGATVFLTHRWGSVEEEALLVEFGEVGAKRPIIIESDVGDGDDMRDLMREIAGHCDSLDIIVSNVAFSKVIHDFDDLKKGSLDLSLKYSAWPVVDLMQTAYEVIGAYPKYMIAISSDGALMCHDGYDMAGASKAVLETLCRYMAVRLKQYGVRVNVIRPGYLDTASSRATFGDDVVNRAMSQVPGLFLDPNQVALTCLALASGWMDAVTGQVIVVDEGWSLVSPISFLTEHGLPGMFPDKAD